MKRIFLLVIPWFSILHTSGLWAFSFSSLFTKQLQEIMPPKEYQVQTDPVISISTTGSVVIKSWDQKDKIALDAVKRGTQESIDGTTLKVSTKDNQVSISVVGPKEKESATIDLTLMVPQQSTLKSIETTQGTIKIKSISGSIKAQTEQGNIEILEATSTIVARSNKGSITLRQHSLKEPHAIFLETIKGSVTVSLPRNVNAHLYAHTQWGTVTSQQRVTLDAITAKLNQELWTRIKQEVSGTLGNGGASITIDVTRGNIILNEY